MDSMQNSKSCPRVFDINKSNVLGDLRGTVSSTYFKLVECPSQSWVDLFIYLYIKYYPNMCMCVCVIFHGELGYFNEQDLTERREYVTIKVCVCYAYDLSKHDMMCLSLPSGRGPTS